MNEKLWQIDAMEVEVERGLARAARLRQAILKAAFEGKLVPQNGADEPAVALLDRIKVERSAAGVLTGGKRKAGKKKPPVGTPAAQ